MLQRIKVGTGETIRDIAVLAREGAGPPVVWLGGFRSDMRSTKAGFLDGWAERAGRALVRFDYAGHGESDGAFEASTISLWLEDTLAGLVLIAPAADFTERLMWDVFPEDIRQTILREGAWRRPSAYSDEPYPITRALIEDGRRHLMLGGPIATGCPVHILQGMRDPDVPWTHAMELVEHLPGDDVSVTLIKDGDHRLSRPEDLERLVAAIEGIGRAGVA
jgi:pimeloyl-ACP methyl ester carboxylesterase